LHHYLLYRINNDIFSITLQVNTPLITGTQIRAARALLNWSQGKLATNSGVSLPTIKRIEARGHEFGGRVDTLQKIQSTVEQAGIVFIQKDAGGGPGVRLGAWEFGGKTNDED